MEGQGQDSIWFSYMGAEPRVPAVNHLEAEPPGRELVCVAAGHLVHCAKH